MCNNIKRFPQEWVDLTTEDQQTHHSSTYVSVLCTRSHVASTRAKSNSTWVSVVRMSFKTALTSTGKRRNTRKKNDFLNFNTNEEKDTDLWLVYTTMHKSAVREHAYAWEFLCDKQVILEVFKIQKRFKVINHLHQWFKDFWEAQHSIKAA